MQTRLLTDAEFHATFAEAMRELTADDAPPVCDIWPYVAAIPSDDLAPFSIAGQDVERVYRSSAQDYDHVLIPTRTHHVSLVIVVDLRAAGIVGHHVLDLNEKYGLPTPASR